MAFRFNKGLLVAVAAFAAAYAAADDDAAAEEGAEQAPQVDVELENELKYVDALIDNGYADFAARVIEAAKKRWPEADVKFFASEIRSLLGVGKYAEAEKRIAALPDRSGSKYWAARLELANNYAYNSRKSECMKIYDEFFAKFPTPPKDLLEFYVNACYTYGQILVMDGREKEAAKVYGSLLVHLKKAGDDERWCQMGCETSDLCLKLAAEAKSKEERREYLDKADKIASGMLWMRKFPVFFGGAIAMKAHVELMRGHVLEAQKFVTEYMPILKSIHDQMVKADPGNKMGSLRYSPMPQCRFLLAEMLWKEAKAEYAKPKRDDEKVKALLFGEKVGGKRNGGGAYNHALNVFINHPESNWSTKAGEMADAIENFAAEKYQAKITKAITPEKLRKVREMQFQNADEKFAEQDYAGAVTNYFEALSKYPEGRISVRAVENIASSYLHMMVEQPAGDGRENLRIDCDAVEGYLSERFSGNPDRSIMSAAGDAVLRLAASEKQYGDKVRAERLHRAFLRNYRRHVKAPEMASSLAGEAMKGDDWEKAAEYFRIIQTALSTNNIYFVPSLYHLSTCYSKMGEKERAIDALKKYTELEPSPLKRMQAQMSLAQMYQKDGLERLAAAATNETPEAVQVAEVEGSKRIIYGIKQFMDFAEKAKKEMENPLTSKGDMEKYGTLREGALYLAGDCWGRLTKPAAKMPDFRKRAIDHFEAYVAEYPAGRYATNAYVKLGTIYTAAGDIEKSRDALARLSKIFPDSAEAKNAKPRLARNLIEMGLKKEGTEIYAEMLRTDGAYTAWQFVFAGEALIDARSWDLANQAFEKAIALASTNQSSVVARARLGEAKSLFMQKRHAEAREALDAFLEDEKMSKLSLALDANFLLVEVASEQGRTEKDAVMRAKTFGAAIGALKKVRQQWAKRNEPEWKQDQTYIMSAEIMKKRMEAEESMGLSEAAMESCRSAATTLQGFLQSHAPSAQNPIENFSAGERKNLENCYAMMVPLFSKLGKDQADKVIRYGSEYLGYFPEGAAKQAVINCMNQARAEGASEAAAAQPEAAPAQPEAAPAAEEATPAAEEAAPAAEEAAPAATEEKNSDEEAKDEK